MRLVIALGGNALSPPDNAGHQTSALLKQSCQQMAELIRRGHEVIVVHGNGPQVGALLLQNEAARDVTPPNTLDICDAETQGHLGYLIQQGLRNALVALAVEKPVVSLVTQVLVDPADPGFHDPAKPVGPVYGEERARQLMEARGYRMREVHPGRWRRVVASPKPLRIVESAAIQALVRTGVVPVTAGGGGIPVVESEGQLEGVEAVVDKDFAAELVGRLVKAEALIILTDVDAAYLDFETPQARRLAWICAEEGWRYLREGHFPPGSMGPKVEACLRFVEHGGRYAVIAPLPHVVAAVDGYVGSQVVKSGGGLG